MRKILNAMKPFIQEISHDFMLCACLIAPIIMGIVFKFFSAFIRKDFVFRIPKESDSFTLFSYI